MRVRDLPDEAGLPDAGLAHDRHELAVAGPRVPERLPELLQLGVAPDEARQPPGRGCPEPRPHQTEPRELVYLDGIHQPLQGHRPEGRDLDIALRQPQRVRRQQGHPRPGELLHPSSQMRRLAHGGVVHAEVGADGPDDHLPGVEPDSNLHVDSVSPANLLSVTAQSGLHVEGGITGSDGVILVGERRAEERHDAVAHHLVHGALVAVDGLHHAFEDGVQEFPGFLGVPVGQ